MYRDAMMHIHSREMEAAKKEAAVYYLQCLNEKKYGEKINIWNIFLRRLTELSEEEKGSLKRCEEIREERMIEYKKREQEYQNKYGVVLAEIKADHPEWEDWQVKVELYSGKYDEQDGEIIKLS